MTQVAERRETFATAFDAWRQQPSFNADGLGDVREAAFGRVRSRGIPTTRDEEWRFTNVAPIAAIDFARPDATEPARTAIEPFLFDAAIPHQAVIVNGRLSRTLSSIGALPAGVTVRSMSEALAAGDTRVRELLEAEAPTVFGDLNAALFEDGLVIEIAPGTIVGEPLHVACILSAGSQPVIASPRVLVRAGEQSQVTLIESFAGIGDGVGFTNAVVHVDVAPSAMVRHVKLQREPASAFHLATTVARVERGGTFTSRAITLGGRLTRNDIVAQLVGEGGECTLDGLYVADGESLVDTHTTIDHAEPHCPSHEVYKGILAGKARAVFNGKIIVRQKAQKTDAKQSNMALLLTDEAQVNTKPQLEIFADDVRCTHGAAIGQLDEDALFYLRARGIAALDARNLLIHAFAGQVLDDIPVPAVRDQAMHLMEQKLSLAEVSRV